MGIRDIADRAVDQFANEDTQRNVGCLLAFVIFFIPVIFVWVLVLPGFSLRSRVIGFGWLFFCMMVALFHGR